MNLNSSQIKIVWVAGLCRLLSHCDDQPVSHHAWSAESLLGMSKGSPRNVVEPKGWQAVIRAIPSSGIGNVSTYCRQGFPVMPSEILHSAMMSVWSSAALPRVGVPLTCWPGMSLLSQASNCCLRDWLCNVRALTLKLSSGSMYESSSCGALCKLQTRRLSMWMPFINP